MHQKIVQVVLNKKLVRM